MANCTCSGKVADKGKCPIHGEFSHSEAAQQPKLDIEKLIKIVLESASMARMDAGYGGRHDDGGAHLMESQVKFYRLGQRGEIPEEWKQYAVLLDPEYTEFLRLKAKFQGK